MPPFEFVHSLGGNNRARFVLFRLDEAREQATALMAVLVPTFEAEFRQH
jgi:hypothetical protein